MNFGVIIRSMGERTEALCLEVCRRVLPESKIHIVRNYYPAYRAYRQMFNISAEKEYDWYLGLDADVVLTKDWYNAAMAKIEEIKNKDYFNFSFSVQDKFLGIIDRGNHFYNNKYTKQALKILEGKTKYNYKPENSICGYIKKESPNFSDYIIGFHGYEQYYKDIFYRFWLRRQRGGNLAKQSEIFRNKNKLNQDKDLWLAKKGWDYKRFFFSSIGLSKKNKSKNRTAILKEAPNLLEKLGFEEKSGLKIDLDGFYRLCGV